ncbi:hypothetical protein [Hydrogenophaga soli]
MWAPVLFSSRGRVGHSRRTQLGLGLLEVAVLVMLVSAAVAGGVLSMRVLQQSQASEWTGDVLRRADRIIVAFVAQNHRLPCPDVDGDGLEDVNATASGCSISDQKGWLPLRTLGLDGSGTVQGSMPRLIYLVQRQAQDLALADPARYNPPAFDNEAEPAEYTGVRPLNHLSTADVCQGIEVARTKAVEASQARAGTRAVAYAVVHPGLRMEGDNFGFDGLNGKDASGVQVELPERGWTLGVYDDRVRVQTYAGLSAALDCPRLLASERNLAFAAEWVDEVNEQKTSTMTSAIIDTTINGIKAGVALLKTGLAVKGLVNAGTHLTAAISALTTALASIVGIVLLPTLAAAIAASIAAIAAYTVTIALAATSLASSLVALGLSMAVAIQAGAEVNAGFNLDQVRTQAQTAYTEAVKRKTDAQARRDQAVSTRDDTKAPAYSAAVSALQNKVSAFANHVNSLNDCGSHATDYNCSPALSLSTYQAQINAVVSGVDRLVDKELAYQDAETVYQQAIDGENNPKPSAPANSPVPAEVRAKLVEALNAAEAAGDTEKKTGLIKAIEYLDSQQAAASTYSDDQRAADLAAQMDQIQTQIDGYAARITSLNTIIGGVACDPLPPDATVRQACVDRALLEQQKRQAQALRTALQTQLSGLSLSVDAALNARNAARTARDGAQGTLNSAKSSLRSSLNNMRYTTCTRGTTLSEDKKTSTPWSNCTIRYYPSVDNDGSVFVSQELMGQTYEGWYKDYDVKLNEVLRSRYDYMLASRSVDKAQASLDQAIQDEADALSTVQALSGMNAGGIAVWSGAADILERADKKGGIR